MTFPLNSPHLQPSHTTPRHRILTASIYISTLQLIAALLLTLMLLWHISTITLVENYKMPEWWVKDFLAEHANGWRVGVWAIVGVLVSVTRVVPMDCVHALLGLDWWCAVLHGRGSALGDAAGRESSLRGSVDQEKDISASMGENANDWSQAAHGRRSPTSTTSRPSSHSSTASAFEAAEASTGSSYTYHPLLQPHISPQLQNLLLSILDILMLAVLASHIVTYFVSLPTAIAFCSIPAILLHPVPEFGANKVPLSLRDRCIGLNVDVHVAGGFAVFMAIVLGLLHVAALVVRAWECGRFGREGVVGKTSVDGGRKVGAGSVDVEASTVSSTVGSSSRSGLTMCSTLNNKSTSHTVATNPTTGTRKATSISAEERSTGVMFVDGSAEQAEQTARRRAVRTDESEGLNGESNWSEMLLECLIDA